MPFDEALAMRVRTVFEERQVACVEKRIMGGICFMVDGKMCIGVEKDRLMARIDPDVYEIALGRKGCAPMDFTGKPMRGFVFVNPEGTASKRDLSYWIALALEFNPRAVASRSQRRVQGKSGVKVAPSKTKSPRRRTRKGL